MSDCMNEEMRDLLPDLAAERLSGADRARVATHVASCDACAAELELLTAARRVMSQGVPAMDVARIVAALPKPPAQAASKPTLVAGSRLSLVAKSSRVFARGDRRVGRSAPGVARPRANQWTGWRIAAVGMVAAGGLTVAVLRQLGPVHPGASGATSVAPVVATPTRPAAPQVAPTPEQPSTSMPAPAPTASPAPSVADTEAGSTASGLAVGSDISELSDGEVESLLQDMSGLEDRPSADPDAAVPALPAGESP